jgi:hypothetical protein
MQEQPLETQKKSQITPAVMLAGAGVVVAIGAVALAVSNQKASETSTAANDTTALQSETVNDEIAGGKYEDGIYEVTGQYVSPGGDEEIGVSVTLVNDVITDVEVEPRATRPISVNMQTIFNENYEQFVMGKNIDEVQLDKVSGSSLTPKGFNDAIEKVKSQAKI